MQVIVFETEEFRDSLKAIRPFSHAEFDCYPDSDNTDSVQILVDGNTQKARMTYKGLYFQISTALPCRSSQGKLNIFADIEDLLLYVEDIETEEFIISAGGLEDKKDGDLKLNIYNEDGEELIGKVDAHYAEKEFYFCDTYAKSRYVSLPPRLVAKTLRQFESFTNDNLLHREQAFVWFNFGTDDTAAIAYTDHAIKRQILKFRIDEPKTFGFLGYIGHSLASLIDKCSKVSITDTSKFYSVMCDGYFIEMLAPKDRHLNYINVLARFKPTLQFQVAKKELLEFVTQAIKSEHWFTYTCLHSKGDYTRLHCINERGNVSMRRFIVNDGYAEDTTICISTHMLAACLRNIKSPKVCFQFNSISGAVNISDSNEPYQPRCAQIVMQKLLTDGEQEIMRYNDSMLDKEIDSFDESRDSDNGMEIIKVGEVFSRHVIPLDGNDHVIPVITDYGIDVVMCFSNPSLKERKAFSDKPIELFLVETRTIPFILLKFGELFTQQFALNVAGMDPYYQSLWLSDPDRCMLRLFLVNSDNAVLVAMRFASLKLMDDIKSVCKKQLQLDRETVNSYIAQTESYLSITEMIDMAQKSEIIGRPEINL